MSDRPEAPQGGHSTRRRFVTAVAGVAGVAGASAAQARQPPSTHAPLKPTSAPAAAVLPFHGRHQQGVTTPQQAHVYFAALDLTTTDRADLPRLMRAWTEAAARLTRGEPADGSLGSDATQPPADSGEIVGLAPARLTLTFGFGPGLFEKDGRDRYGLAARRPEAFADLPHFVGDQLVPQRTGGDLCVQACADEPQVAFHAVRQLTRLALPYAATRWVQNGFLAGYAPGEAPRNLMGFKDGTLNVAAKDPKALDQFVWVGPEGDWMRDGTYLVGRPIRIALEHWDRMKLGFQEQTVGRHKLSGAPLGGSSESEPLRLDAVDKEGELLTPENAHVRLAAPETNGGAQVLRRSYSYDNGVSLTAERWPPWRQAMELDAGLLFVCYQKDPRTGFTKLFDRMSKFDMLNQFVTHVGGGLYACPAGVSHGDYLGEALLRS